MKTPTQFIRNSVPALLVLVLLAGTLIGQEQKQLSIAIVGAPRPSLVRANEIERGTGYPALIHLKGGVEIKTPVCLPTGLQGKVICDGSMILRADEATYHEDSGRIEARGSVTVIPLVHEK